MLAKRHIPMLKYIVGSPPHSELNIKNSQALGSVAKHPPNQDEHEEHLTNLINTFRELSTHP